MRRRRERHRAYTLDHGITPESIKSNFKDILASPYEKDRVLIPVGVAEDSKPFLGSNFQATLKDLEAKMREAAIRLCRSDFGGGADICPLKPSPLTPRAMSTAKRR